MYSYTIYLTSQPDTASKIALKCFIAIFQGHVDHLNENTSIPLLADSQ